MHQTVPLSRVIDLTDPAGNRIYNMTVEEARALVASGDAGALGRIDGEFALVGQSGRTVSLARTIGRLLRYFIAKWHDGPILIVADRIDAIRGRLGRPRAGGTVSSVLHAHGPRPSRGADRAGGLSRPEPDLCRFFTPSRNALPADVAGDRRPLYHGCLSRDRPLAGPGAAAGAARRLLLGRHR